MMKKININKTILCLILSEICEIAVLCIKVIKKRDNLWLIGMIIISIGLYIIGLKNNKDYGFRVVGEKIFPYFLLYIGISQLIYEIIPINLIGIILSIPAIIMAFISLIIYLNNYRKM